MRGAHQKIDSSPLLRANAEMRSQRDLLQDVAVSQWSIGRNSVAFEKTDSHTLSLYLAGGETSFRADQTGKKGGKGVLCMMPQGHASRWQIGGQVDFVHLYFSDHILKQFSASHFDCDVRRVELRDLTYEQDPGLRNLMLAYLERCEIPDEKAGLLSEQLLYQIFDHLIRRYNGFDLTNKAIQGGLAPQHMRRIKAAIHDGLQHKLTIEGLASLVGLSPFHFARQFKKSFGETPAGYVTRARVARVKGLLATTTPLATIAVMCGFAQQSHMTGTFKKATGITPLAYRKYLVEKA